MNVEQIREYCLSKKGVTEDFPFDEVTLVLQVMGKMFALVSLEEIPLRLNLKCEPEQAVELTEKYESVLPGYHMNKKHWNSIIVDGSIHSNEIKNWMDDSYKLVVQGLKKSDRDKLLKG